MMRRRSRPPGSTPRRSTSRAGVVLQHGVMLVAVVVALAPGAFILLTALRTQREYRLDTLGLPSTLSFENFRAVLLDNPLLLWMRNSILVASGAVLLSTVVAALAAFAIAKMRFRGRDASLSLSTALMVLPPVVLVVPLYVLYTQLGLIGTFHGVIMIYAGLITPFSVYLLVSFFRSIPDELMEAAVMDGASPLRILWRIVLPLSRTALLTLAIVNILYVWNDLLIALLFLPGDRNKTLMAGLSVLAGRYNNQVPLSMAGMAMASAPMIVLYIAFQRYFIRGMTAGALKG
jgi:ABC-type glycerol-3-phosphate transport system permease component